MPLGFIFNSTYYLFCYLLLASVLSACSLQTYVPAPLNLEQKIATYHQRNLESPELNAFLALNNTSAPSSGQAWDLSALIQSALFLHPDLALAKASYRTSQLQLAQAQIKPTPSISTQIARSNRANGDIDPFGLSLAIDLPIQTNDKQAIRVATLSHLSEIAKLEIAQTAWQVRSGVMQSSLALYQQARQADLLKHELEVRDKIAQLLSKRVAYGEANSLALNQAKLAMSETQQQLATSQKSLTPIRTKLAQNISVSPAATDDLNINLDTFDRALNTTITADFSETSTQRAAVINHLALRKALLHYAVAEQSLKLEYAKQIPDIVLSPSYAFEFGDSVWSLGFNSLMTLLKKNKVGIAKAQQLRQQEVAQFEATQHQVLSTAQIALAEYHATRAQLQSYKTTIKTNLTQRTRLQKQFDAGLIDRLALTLNELTLIESEKIKASLEHQLLATILDLEAALQTPIITTDKPFESIEALSQMNQSAL